VLVLGGSREMPGAVILAATAALRAGAGKLTIATGRSVAQLVALAIPESMVLGLDETDNGGFTLEAVSRLDPLAKKISAILIGPGMQDEAPPRAWCMHCCRACMAAKSRCCWMRMRWAPCCIRLAAAQNLSASTRQSC
jgi:NAD(P)H-hydrate repair Nnr-like enzyme with NAD(P)H-hydrate dehydratase domain